MASNDVEAPAPSEAVKSAAKPMDTDAAKDAAESVSPPKDDRNEDEKLETYKVPSDDPRWKAMTEDRGILKWVLREAPEDAETPENDVKIRAHYTGMLSKDGKKFDSSVDRGDFFEFNVGQGKVIKGWDQGFITMKVGEKAVLRLAPDYAYGEAGSPPNIPPNSSLDFVVELVAILDFDELYDCDSQVLKKVLVKTDEWKTGKPAGTVKVTYTGRVGSATGKVFMEGKEEDIAIPYDEEFEGKGSDPDHPHCRAFYKAISNVTQGGKNRFKCLNHPAWTYGPEEAKKLDIPTDADIFFDVECHKLDNPKGSWELDPQEKIDLSKADKEKANAFFKKGKIKIASKLYTDISNRLTDDSKFSEDQKKAMEPLLVSVLSNLALVSLRKKEYKEAEEHCDKALAKEKSNVKLLYRRAQARFNRENWEDALTDLVKALEVDPKNGPCIVLKKKIKRKLKEYEKQRRKLAKAMFGGGK